MHGAQPASRPFGSRSISPHISSSIPTFSTLRTALDDYNIPPGTLELELTEAVLMDDLESASRTLAELKKMGVRLAIDDFGTSYSSLS